MVIVDSRPFDEYHRMNIPGATDMPGAELVYRIHDLTPDPETFVVVNCAGRTRSIIGAQSLINAGIPNPVAALKDGTMGWHLAGYELERGAARKAPAPGAAGRQKAQAAAARVAARFGVRSVRSDEIPDWLTAAGRTTFLLDVRSPEEYTAGHLPGFRNAPGGQLVQATDEYVGVKNARLVLADDSGVRATMTASWLIQMGWQDVFVLEGGTGIGPLTSDVEADRLPEAYPQATLSTQALARRLEGGSGTTTVIDLDLSSRYERAHIPGAFWSVRARLDQALTSGVGKRSDRTHLHRRTAGPRGPARCPGTCRLRGGGAGRRHRTLAGGKSTHGVRARACHRPHGRRLVQALRSSWRIRNASCATTSPGRWPSPGQIERDGTTRFQAFQ